MSIRFQCEQCGHTMDLDDRYQGKHGKCKHCGHSIVVPMAQSKTSAHGTEEGESPLRLRPLNVAEPTEAVERLLAPASNLKIRPAEADPRIVAAMISEADAPPLTSQGRAGDYKVADDQRPGRRSHSSGPPPDWQLVPVRTARWVSSNLRTLRDWLYVASLACLVAVLLGYLFQWKNLLHLGAVGVVASNISMLYVGVAYLVSLPFKESFKQGMANLLIPFYAIYYWSTRWARMKTAVYKTLGSFLPIALVGLAYLAYEEAPVVEAAVERRLPGLEKRLGRMSSSLESKADTALAPLKERVDPLLGSEKTENRSKTHHNRSNP